jgi:hypothetical protein
LGCGEGERLTFTTAPLSDGKGPGIRKDSRMFVYRLKRTCFQAILFTHSK